MKTINAFSLLLDSMRKLIDIPEKDKTFEKLSILAVKSGKDLKNYIQDVLILHAKLPKS